MTTVTTPDQTPLASTAVEVLRRAYAAAETHRPWEILFTAAVIQPDGITGDLTGTQQVTSAWPLPGGTLTITVARDLVPRVEAKWRGADASSCIVYRGDARGLRIERFREGRWCTDLAAAVAAQRDSLALWPLALADNGYFTADRMQALTDAWAPLP